MDVFLGPTEVILVVHVNKMNQNKEEFSMHMIASITWPAVYVLAYFVKPGPLK